MKPGNVDYTSMAVKSMQTPDGTDELRALLIARIDGEEPDRSPLAASLKKAGFLPGSRGYLKRLGKTVSGKAPQEVELTAES